VSLYRNLTDAAGNINHAAVEALTLAKACTTHASCIRIGWKRDFAEVLAEQAVIVKCMANTIRDSIIAAKIRASLPDREKAARTLDLEAEICETATPPRMGSAALCRAQASMLRIAEGLA
jgi:hypothetical protein